MLCGLAGYSGLLHGQRGKAARQTTATAAGSQTSPTSQTSTADAAASEQNGTDLDDDDDGPSPGNFLGTTYVPSINEPLAGSAAATVAAAPPPPKPVPADAGGDPVRQQINNETANLLAMAYALKAEVDKTNKDQLSIAVVRKASQIELQARKMRDDIKPALSRN